MAQVMNISASITGGLSLSTLGAGAWMARVGTSALRNAPSAGAKTATWSYNAVKHPKKTFDASRRRIKQAIANVRGF